MFTLGLRTLVMTFHASLSMESLSLSGGSAQERLRPRDANNKCWRTERIMRINYDIDTDIHQSVFDLCVVWYSCVCVCVCHLGKSSFIAVFDHSNKVCSSRCNKFCPECPHDRVQQESTMGKWMNNVISNTIYAAVVKSILDF